MFVLHVFNGKDVILLTLSDWSNNFVCNKIMSFTVPRLFSGMKEKDLT